ncbi:hypothetical protein SDRG_13201 [Saprolegnia diclina VS20]|uniref:Uncharacterized protein n=1 Tax=Saprolegnia diclina (strain VS20) TaxID=1156394 RepID=T0RGY0_SAPDV|nr:hypothetical protein SDRG_13201 [Saprolegnia diclina VS20]EQC29047.1 hypothetical protein SDRG_13201 [Saprolegnia diclina VS20]|eukprot:XP_008617506.1 hypothetical protein SDRG_13201 [Saprolegnia diclina VS20]
MLPEARGKDVRLESPPLLNPLHEKFDSWLTSTFALSPQGRKPRKRTARLLRPLLGHSASEPTAATVHAEKQLSAKPKRPVTSLPSIETIQRQRFAALVAEASYRSFSYPSRLGLGPGLLFTKALGALANSDDILLPATLVREESGTYRLVYSNADQRICTREYASKADVEADAPRLLRLFTRRQQAICAAVKTYDPATKSNTLDLLETRQDVARALRSLLLVTSGVVGLQEFIAAKPNRVQSSLLVRCAFVPTRPKQSVVWVFTDTAHPVVDTTDAQACRVDKATAPTSWATPRAQTQVLVTAMMAATSIRFTALVADFAQDDEGRWWCLQVKAFRAADVEARAEPEKPATTPKCAGQFCKENATPREMAKQPLLYKDLLRGNFLTQNSELPNVAAAYEVYAQSWSRRVRNQLYNRVLVCTKCYDRYNQLLTVPSQPSTTVTLASSASLQQLLASMEAMVPELAPLSPPGTDPSTPKDIEDEAPTNQEPTPRALTKARVVHEETENVCDIESQMPLTTTVDPRLERPVSPEISPCCTSQAPTGQSSQAVISSRSAVVEDVMPVLPLARRASVVDSFWDQLQPAKPLVAPVPSAATIPVVVLPKHSMSVDPSRLFFDDQYKQSVLVEMHAVMADMHTVVISATSDDATATMALQSLFLEVQDDCIEGVYGLDAVDTINSRPQLTVTPHFSTPSRSIG